MNNKKHGIILALSAAILWGFSGNIAEYIFNNSNLNVGIYTTLRMFFTGVLLLIYGLYTNNIKQIKNLLLNKKTILNLIFYSIVGIALLQYSFALTVSLSNAAFTTLIQFLTPLMILIYLSLKYKKIPKNIEIICTLVALLGMFLMITAGNINTLKVSIFALILGLFSAITFTFYILYAKNLFHLPTTIIIGLGMIIGSISIMPFVNFETIIELKKINILIAFSFNVLFGNILPFYLFSESTRYISAKITSLISGFEPLTALFIGILFMNNNFEYIQIIGAFLIIISVTLLSIKSE